MHSTAEDQAEHAEKILALSDPNIDLVAFEQEKIKGASAQTSSSLPKSSSSPWVLCRARPWHADCRGCGIALHHDHRRYALVARIVQVGRCRLASG